MAVEKKSEVVTEFSIKGKKIPKDKLVQVWKKITKKPFPYGKIQAMLLDSNEADRIYKIFNESENIRMDTETEYGVDVKLDKTTDAFTTITSLNVNSKFLIIIRKDSSYTLEYNLAHELLHIAKGDITLDGKLFGK